MADVTKPQVTRVEPNRLTGLKKRQQIEGASRAMFIWVAIAAVALSFCVATGQYLFTKWEYNNRVIGAKYKAAQTLSDNINNAKQLKQAVDSLVANQDLASVKTNPDDPNTKSILDALPTTFDPSALGTSLQQSILSRSGVSIESISVPQDAGTSTATGSTTTTTAAPQTSGAAAATPQTMQFSFVVTGTFDQIKTMVGDLERTIRPIKLTSISLSGSDASLRATIQAETYYQPGKTVNVQKEVVK